MSDKDKRCEAIEHPNLMPGWGCCICKTYNGEQRPTCKICNHNRCDKSEANKAN